MNKIHIIKQGDSYLYLWSPSETTHRFESQQLSHQQRTELQAAIQAGTQIVQQLTATSIGDSPRNIASHQILERLGRVIFNELLPDPLKNFLSQLKGPAALVFSTNLGDIPWELLHDQEGFLALRHAIGRQPIVTSTEKFVTNRQSEQPSILLLGNPTNDLPATTTEIADLADLWKEVTPHVHAELGVRVTRMRVLEALSAGEYDFIHFAGHATPGELCLADGALTLREIRRALRGSPISPVLFLNACQSAQVSFAAHTDTPETMIGEGIPFAGQQAASLASVLIEEGACAFIGTLWPVFDHGAQRFAQDFYQAIIQGKSLGEALRLARLESWKRQPDALLWSSYVLSGDSEYCLSSIEVNQEKGTALIIEGFLRSSPAQSYKTEANLRTAQQQIGRWLKIISKHNGEIASVCDNQIIAVFRTSASAEYDVVFAMKSALDILHDTGELQELPILCIACGNVLKSSLQPLLGSGYYYSGAAIVHAKSLLQLARPGDILTTNATRLLDTKELYAYEQIHLDETSKVRPGSEIHRVSYRQNPNESQFKERVEKTGDARYPLHKAHLVGRDEQLQFLHSCWQHAQTAHGRVIGIFGDAGIGKSRLLQEFLSALPVGSNDTPNHQVISLTCPIVDQQRPYALLSRLLHCLLDFNQVKDNDQRTLRLQHFLATLPPNAIDAQSLAIAQRLVGIHEIDPLHMSGDPKSQRNRLVRLFQAIWITVSKNAPFLLCVDDMHQIDEASLEVLSLATDTVNRYPVLFVFLYREDWSHPWLQKAYYSPLAIPRLERDQEVQLLRSILDTAQTPNRLLPLLDRASGNPFHLEEMIAWLHEQEALTRRSGEWRLLHPLEEMQLPDTLYRLEIRRINNLPEEERTLLRIASVLGERFTVDLLQKLVLEPELPIEDYLQELVRKAILDFQVEEGEYRFRHAVMRETVYESFAERQRCAYHSRIARFVETEMAVGTEQVELLAHHYFHGLDPFVAIPHCLQAGERALAVWANQTALTWFERALERHQSFIRTSTNERHGTNVNLSIAQLAEWRERASEGRADVLTLMGQNQEAIQMYEDLLQRATQSDAPLQRQASILVKLSKTAYELGVSSEVAEQYADTGLRLLGTNISAETGQLYLRKGIALVKLGHLKEALTVCEQAIAIFHSLDDRHPALLDGNAATNTQILRDRAQSHNLLGVIHRRLGSIADARAQTEQSVTLYRNCGYEIGLLRALGNLGAIYMMLGQMKACMASLQEAAGLCQRIGEVRLQASIAIDLGEAYRFQGAFANALEHYQLAGEIGNEHDLPDVILLAQNNSALVYLKQGKLEMALSLLEHCLQTVEQHELEIHKCEVLRNFAEVHLLKGQIDQAMLYAGQAREVAEKTQDQVDIGSTHRIFGQISLSTGQFDQSLEHLECSMTIFRDSHALYDLGMTLIVQLECYSEIINRRSENDSDVPALQKKSTDIYQEVLQTFGMFDNQIELQHAKRLFPFSNLRA